MPEIFGITRVRNEELILEDTLRHVLARTDGIILYDDCSTDRTVEIASSFDRVIVLRGDEWRKDRANEETRHRAILLDAAKSKGAEWCWCFDADERIIDGLFSNELSGDGYKFRLFDGYLASGYDMPYLGAGRLQDLPRMWGPEYRDILMLFRTKSATYKGRDKRAPHVAGTIESEPLTVVQHYGKCLSIAHWEETCNYYANNWGEPYRSKWAARRGKAIHTESDFGRPLYPWPEVQTHGVKL